MGKKHVGSSALPHKDKTFGVVLRGFTQDADVFSEHCAEIKKSSAQHQAKLSHSLFAKAERM